MSKSLDQFAIRLRWFCYGGTVAIILGVAFVCNIPAAKSEVITVTQPAKLDVSYSAPVFVPLPSKQLVPPESFTRFMQEKQVAFKPLPLKHRKAR